MSCPFGSRAARTAVRQRSASSSLLLRMRRIRAWKALRQRGVRYVPLVLVELTRGEKAARRNKRLVQLTLTTVGLPIPEISGNQHQLRPAAGCRIRSKEGEQGADLMRPPVQFLQDQQPVRRVALAKREFVDAALSLPFGKTAPKVTLNAGCRLVAFLRSFGEQLHDDCRESGARLYSLRARWAAPASLRCGAPLHRIRSREGNRR